VLSNQDLKQIYDNYGEKILKDGLPTGVGHPGYAFNGECYGKYSAHHIYCLPTLSQPYSLLNFDVSILKSTAQHPPLKEYHI